MNTPRHDVDSLIEALQSDLPSERDEARVRARLFAASVVATTAVVSSGAAATSASANAAAGAGALGGAGGLSTAPLGAAQAGLLSSTGLLSKVIALPLAAKIGVATTVAIGVAAGSVPMLRETRPVTSDAAMVAAAERSASEPRLRGGVARADSAAPSQASPGFPAAVPSQLAGSNARSSAPSPRVRVNESSTVSAPTQPAVRSATATVQGAPSAKARAIGARSALSGTARAESVGGDGMSHEARSLEATSTADATGNSEATSTADVMKTAEAPRPVAPATTAYASASTLAEETGLMERAIAALNEGDRERARHWLAEHARRFPNGLLARERYRALARVEHEAR